MNTTENTPSPRISGVFPAFKARDARTLIAWLVDTLGFVENVAYTDGDRIAHAQLDWPRGGSIMLGDLGPGGAWDREPGVNGVYLVSDDIDALYSRASAAGATIVREPTDQDYDSREFAVADPEGNLWSIGTYPGESTKT